MKNNIPIVCYHSIAPKINHRWSRNWLTLEIKFFSEHLKYLKNNGYKSLFMDEYFELRDKDIIDNKYFVFTFDDGYVDNYIYVYPLLKKYGFKGTIFVNPDFIDGKSTGRKTLLDYWDGKATLDDIVYWGFLNWDEMHEMEKNGIIDIQSHTLTHTKYFVSDKIVGFHHPGSDCIYPVGNMFPERKPYYITDTEFEKHIPYGYPLFEEQSAVIANKVTINEEFNELVIEALADYEWNGTYDYYDIFDRIKDIYQKIKRKNEIIDKIETTDEYNDRVYKELKDSKGIIEANLDKRVDYLCWPHGDNNEYVHKMAIDIGYRATSAGKMISANQDDTRYNRITLGGSMNRLFLTRWKTRYKIESTRKKQPYYSIKNVYEFFRDRL
jgi:hypothetical protein